jgi:hypothetical protein
MLSQGLEKEHNRLENEDVVLSRESIDVWGVGGGALDCWKMCKAGLAQSGRTWPGKCSLYPIPHVHCEVRAQNQGNLFPLAPATPFLLLILVTDRQGHRWDPPKGGEIAEC